MKSRPAPTRRPFSRRVRQMLCERLLELPEMPNLGRRDHLMRQLAQEFPGLDSVPRHEHPHIDLVEILSAAYDYPGALRALWEIVNFLYAPDNRLTEIKGLVDAIEPEPLLTDAERQSVLGLLASADTAMVAAAFHYSARETVEDAGLDPRDVTAVATRVEAFPGYPGRLPPYFDFVDYIGHRCHKSTRVGLHLWMDQASHRLGFTDRSAVDKVCQATENRVATNGRFFLVTEVSPDREARDRFFLAAWRQCGDEPEEMVYQADQSVTWDEAITSVHALMRNLAVGVEETAEQRVLELIVPRCLVTESLDQWCVDPALPSAIGTNYPLVLRSFDRLDDPSMHGDWGRNWRWLKEHGRSAGIGALREVESHELAAVQALRGALLQDGPPAAVLMLKSLPASDVLTVDAFTAGLRGGAPIMVWSRKDSTTDALAAHIRSASSNGLLDLPEYVFQLRLRALDDAEGLLAGEHIALVFDDFDRIPERYRGRSWLRSPRPWRPSTQ